MNSKQPLRAREGGVIRFGGNAYTFSQACALALTQQNHQHFESAMSVYDLILAQDPGYAEVHNNRGICLQALRRHGEALAAFERTIALKPDYANAHNNRAAILKDLKRFDEALAGYDRTLALQPDHAGAHNNRGAVLHKLGRQAEALGSLDQAIALKPDYVNAHHNRGQVLQALKRHEEALASYDGAIALDPRYVESHNNRGLVLQAMTRPDEALASYENALALKPGHANAHNNRSASLLGLNRHDEALASCNRAVALEPGNAEFHSNRGAVLQALKRQNEALASYDQAAALKPAHAQFHNNRGGILQGMRRDDEALASYDRAIALEPGTAEFHHNRAVILQRMKRYDEALASHDQAIVLKPNHAGFHYRRGLASASKGDMQEAERMFSRALELDPNFADPLAALAGIRKYGNADDPEAKRIQTLLDSSDTSAEAKESLYFSLGKIYDDCGRYEEAFQSYERGNQLRNATVAYHAGRVTEMITDVMEVFSRDFLARPSVFGSDSRSPLFVVGMPRSGTTLMASILSNHRAIATAGELPTIAEFVQRIEALVGISVPFPKVAMQLTPAVATRLIQEYEMRLRRDAGPTVPHVVDKQPLNFWHLGFISLLFPHARIIHCTRHPLDTGLSNYFQRFDRQYEYSFDLRNIGHFYGQYVRLMKHWGTVLPVKMIEISYEDMILNTEPMVRRLLEFLGLEWDERCLAPHTNPAPVETASQWQVRQPIYNQSVERWRHYEKQLAPLQEILARDGLLPA